MSHILDLKSQCTVDAMKCIAPISGFWWHYWIIWWDYEERQKDRHAIFLRRWLGRASAASFPLRCITMARRNLMHILWPCLRYLTVISGNHSLLWMYILLTTLQPFYTFWECHCAYISWDRSISISVNSIFCSTRLSNKLLPDEHVRNCTQIVVRSMSPQAHLF